MALEDQLLNNFRRLAPEQKQNLLDFSLKLLQSPGRPQEAQFDEARGSLFGIFKDLGPAPSEQDISQTRAEAWRDWPAGDL